MNSAKLGIGIAVLTIAGAIGVYVSMNRTNTRLSVEKAQGSKIAEAAPGENEMRRLKELGIAKMAFAQAWGFAFLSYAHTNGGSMPATFQDAAKYFKGVREDRNPSGLSFSPDEFEIVFHGSLNDLDDPQRIMIFREKQSFAIRPSGRASRTYQFADGHTEIHAAENGDFEPWEKEHTASRPK